MVESAKATTIEISMEAYEMLHRVQEKLEKITRKRKISFDQVIKTCFAVHPLEVILQDMILEDALTH